MLRAFLALLFLVAVGFGQPLEGPFTVLELDSGRTFFSLNVLPSSGDTVGLIYTVHTSQMMSWIYYAAFSFETHTLVGEPILLISGASASVEGASALPDGRWACAILDDLYLRVFSGHTGQVDGQLLVATGHMEGPRCSFTCWSYSHCNFAARVGGGFVMTVSEDWFFDIGGGAREIDGHPLLFVFDTDPLQIAYQTEDPPRSTFNSAIAYPVSLAADTTVVVVANGAGVSGSWWYYEDDNAATPPLFRDSTCEANLLAAARTPGNRVLGAVNTYQDSEYPEPGVIQLVDSGPCTFLGGFGWGSGWLDAVAFSPNTGFAAVSRDYYAVELARLDTNGATAYPIGTVARWDSIRWIRFADVGLSSGGRVVVAFTEFEPYMNRGCRLLISSLGWNTALGSDDPHFVPQPSSFSISAFPNPFNSELWIEYSLPGTQNVQLSVYNLLGQKVVTLFDGMGQAGVHQAVWSPSEAGGVYFVTLKAGEQSRVTKVLYLR